MKQSVRSLAYGLAAMVMQFAGCSSHATHDAQKQQQWIVNGPALKTYTTDPDAVRFFSSVKTYVVTRKNSGLQIPSSWNALPTRIFTSYAALNNAFASEAIGPDVKAILYDSEAWKFTPEEEQRDFAGYSRRVADLVHGHGLVFINAPAVTLARDLSAPGERRYDAYLRLQIAADGARYADVFEIQAQGSEMALERYRSFVQAAAEQARGANPKVAVLAGISTSPSGQTAPPERILAAVQATRDTVDGYWLNVPAPSDYCPDCKEFRPDAALSVLRRLQ